ncbi:hypothetical protein V1515DRAFT_630967, partial [Lipomyces mesembrius]
SSNGFWKETGEGIIVQEIYIPNLRENAIDRLKHRRNKDWDDLLDTSPQRNFKFDMMSTVSVNEAMKVLRGSVEYHEYDSPPLWRYRRASVAIHFIHSTEPGNQDDWVGGHLCFFLASYL